MLRLLRPVFPTLHRYNDRTELDLHRIKRGFHGAFARVWHASRERLPFRTPSSASTFLDLLVLQLLRPDSSNLPCLYSTFHLFLDFALGKARHIFTSTRLLREYTVFGIFSSWAFQRKWPQECVHFSLSPIFAIWRTVNADLLQCFIFCVCILAIWKSLRTQRKLHPREKFQVYGRRFGLYMYNNPQ